MSKNKKIALSAVALTLLTIFFREKMDVLIIALVVDSMMIFGKKIKSLMK